jgi:hypothetical protein
MKRRCTAPRVSSERTTAVKAEGTERDLVMVSSGFTQCGLSGKELPIISKQDSCSL